MTVAELISTNAFIVECYICIRGEYINSLFNGEREYSKGQFVHQFAIGQCATLGKYANAIYKAVGERGKKFKEPYTIINKELNMRANKDHWGVILNVIPKSVQDLEVGDWDTTGAYSWKKYRTQSVGYEAAQVLNITVYFPEDEVTEIRIEAEIKHNEQLEGQMNLLDILQ